MSVYLTPRGWHAIRTLLLLALFALSIGLLIHFVPFREIIARNAAATRTEAPQAVVPPQPPAMVAVIPNTPPPPPVLPATTFRLTTVDDTWLPQKSLHNTHFTVRDGSIIGDNITGQAGIAKEIDHPNGVWIGAYLNANSDETFDHRIMIRAGNTLHAGYAANRVESDDGYAIRIVADAGKNPAVEFWHGNMLNRRFPSSTKYGKRVHVIIGFAPDGSINGRVVAHDGAFDFGFAAREIRSKGRSIAFSAIAVGQGSPVFEKVAILAVAPDEKFRSSEVLEVRTWQMGGPLGTERVPDAVATVVAATPPVAPRPPPAPSRPPLPMYQVTAKRYSELDNANAAVVAEFGKEYRVLDWDDIKPHQLDIAKWMHSVGMELGEANSLWVTCNGERQWQKGRYYFITRFDGKKIGDYLAHDNFGRDKLCLGSFHGRRYRILAIRK